MSVSIACPVCQSRAVARSSRKLSDTLREIRYRCENDECGHIYIAHLEAVRTVVPSALQVSAPLPLSPHSRVGRLEHA